jgi:hypothetical protein
MSGTPAHDVTKNRSKASHRLRGVDASSTPPARSRCLLGMVMVHFGPSPVPDTALGNLYSGVSHGRASVLFVLLAGVGWRCSSATDRPGGDLSLAGS